MDEIELKYQIINNIYKATENLLKIKNKLANLEKNGNNDFHLLLNEYKMALYLEEGIYNKIYNNSDILIDFLNYLYQRYDIDYFDISIDSLVHLDDNLIYKRIVNKLNEYIFKLPMDKVYIEDNDSKLSLDSKKIKMLEEERKKIRNRSFIKKYLSIDLIKLILMHIDYFIRSNNRYRSELIELKYNMIFVCSEVEDESIYNDFDANKFYLMSRMVSDLLFVNKEEYNQIKVEFFNTIIDECDRSIITEDDEFVALMKEMLLSSVDLLLEKNGPLKEVTCDIDYKMLVLRP